MTRRLITLCLWIMMVGVAIAQTLQERLDTLMAQTPFLRTSEVGIAVYDAQSREPLYLYQADKLFRPASTQKVVTAVTALGLLGGGHTFTTTLAYTGSIANGVLEGDLYVIGGYDTEFNVEDLQRMQASVLRAGIGRINGRVYGDASLTTAQQWGPGWCWDDAPYTYMPYLSPLMLNKGYIDLTLYPAGRGETARVSASPLSPHYQLVNNTLSRTPSAGNVSVQRNWQTHGNTITITGNVSTTVQRKVTIFDSKALFMSAFVYGLMLQGVEMEQTEPLYATCPPEAQVLFTAQRNIAGILQDAMKESNNLAAEALFAHAGIFSEGQKTGSFKLSQQTAIRFAESRLGFGANDFNPEDGSGVSPYNLIAPAQLAQYLLYAYGNSQIFPYLYEALPIAGVDGTLKNRMKSGRAFRNVRAKTGTVTGVSALAGYAKNGEGRDLVFVILHQNILKASLARDFQDKVCQLLCE